MADKNETMIYPIYSENNGYNYKKYKKNARFNDIKQINKYSSHKDYLSNSTSFENIEDTSFSKEQYFLNKE